MELAFTPIEDMLKLNEDLIRGVSSAMAAKLMFSDSITDMTVLL